MNQSALFIFKAKAIKRPNNQVSTPKMQRRRTTGIPPAKHRGLLNIPRINPTYNRSPSQHRLHCTNLSLLLETESELTVAASAQPRGPQSVPKPPYVLPAECHAVQSSTVRNFITVLIWITRGLACCCRKLVQLLIVLASIPLWLVGLYIVVFEWTMQLLRTSQSRHRCRQHRMGGGGQLPRIESIY